MYKYIKKICSRKIVENENKIISLKEAKKFVNDRTNAITF
jgi:hypothetical protein